MNSNEETRIKRPYLSSDEDEQVLDLSKRRDSIETRNTPSPYIACKSSDESPSTRSSIGSEYNCTRTSSAVVESLNNLPYMIGYTLMPPKSSNINTTTCYNNQTELNQYQLLQNSLLRRDLEFPRNPSARMECPQKTLPDSTRLAPLVVSDSGPETSMVASRDGKLSRPFKAYPHDPLSLTATGTFLDNESAAKYNLFRQKMLEQIHSNGNDASPIPRVRRLSKSYLDKSNPPESTTDYQRSHEENVENAVQDVNLINNNNCAIKDLAYYERRRKNNAAAKKSRDRRRMKEDEIAIRAAFLERENIELKVQLATLKKQLEFYEVAANS